jgi:hypothetical protein
MILNEAFLLRLLLQMLILNEYRFQSELLNLKSQKRPQNVFSASLYILKFYNFLYGSFSIFKDNGHNIITCINVA